MLRGYWFYSIELSTGFQKQPRPKMRLVRDFGEHLQRTSHFEAGSLPSTVLCGLEKRSSKISITEKNDDHAYTMFDSYLGFNIPLWNMIKSLYFGKYLY